MQIDAKLSVGVATVKSVVQQLASGAEVSDAVQAVLPRGMLEAGVLPPSVASLVQPVVTLSSSVPRVHLSSLRRHESAPAADTSSRWAGMSSADVRLQVHSEVKTAVRELLGDDGSSTVDINTQAPLMEMGLDSLAATQLGRQLSEDFDGDMSPTLLFDYPTIEALTDHFSPRTEVEESDVVRPTPINQVARTARRWQCHCDRRHGLPPPRRHRRAHRVLGVYPGWHLCSRQGAFQPLGCRRHHCSRRHAES